MRGIRIAAFAVAAVLACVVISHMFSVDPAGSESGDAPQTDNSADLGMSAPPSVPPPPPLAGSQAVRPVRKHSAAAKPAKPQVSAGFAQNAAQNGDADAASEAAVPKPVIWRGNDPAADNQDEPAAAVARTAPVDQPPGPVIVVPHERPKQDSRGMRWLKAVGHALGIGGPKDPVEQAFQ